MKTVRYFTLFVAAVAAILALAPTLARAGDISMNAAGFENLTVASCVATPNSSTDVSGVGGETFITRNCSGTADQGFGFHFNYPADAPLIGTPFSIHIAYTGSDTNAGNIVHTAQICCITGLVYTPLTCGTVVTGSAVANPGATLGNALAISQGHNIGSPGLPSGVGTDQFCFLKITRPSSTNVLDTYTSVTRDLTARIHY